MKNILDEIYYNYYDKGKIIIKGNSPLIINCVESRLLKELKGRHKMLFVRYEAACSEYNSLTAIKSFKQGFKEGMKFERELHKL